MKHVLILDTNPLPLDNSFLPDQYQKDIHVDEVKNIYQVIRKLLFGTRESTANHRYDLLIVGFTSPDEDMEKMNFIRYIKRNKPELPLLIFSHQEKEWLTARSVVSVNENLGRITDRRDISKVLENFLAKGSLD